MFCLYVFALLPHYHIFIISLKSYFHLKMRMKERKKKTRGQAECVRVLVIHYGVEDLIWAVGRQIHFSTKV